MKTLLGAATVAAIAWPTHAQNPSHFSGAPTCPSCRIVTEKLFTLGTPQDPMQLSGNLRVEADRQGRFFAFGEDNYHIVVFDSAGRYLTAIGGQGSGPGEFGVWLSRIGVGPGDTLFAMDASHWVNVFSPSLQFVRRIRVGLGGMSDFVPLAGGRVLLGSDGASTGLPFNLFDANRGAPVLSFGPVPVPSFSSASREPSRGGGVGGAGAPPTGIAHAPIDFTSHLAVTTDGDSFWATSITAYAFAKWSLQGNEEKPTIIIDAPWWSRDAKSQWDSVLVDGRWKAFELHAAPSVDFVTIDRSNLLWFMGSIPVPGGEGKLGGFAPRTRVLEVVDPESRRVLASTPMSAGFYAGIRGTDLVFTGRRDADGFPRLEVWRLALVGR